MVVSARGKCHIARRAAGHLKGVVILSRTRMHAVDQEIPCDQVMYGDVDPGALRNANHRSGDLQSLAALRESAPIRLPDKMRLRGISNSTVSSPSDKIPAAC